MAAVDALRTPDERFTNLPDFPYAHTMLTIFPATKDSELTTWISDPPRPNERSLPMRAMPPLPQQDVVLTDRHRTRPLPRRTSGSSHRNVPSMHSRNEAP